MADSMSGEDVECLSVTFPAILAFLIRLAFCSAPLLLLFNPSKARDFLVMERARRTDVSPFDVIDSARLLRQSLGERETREGERKDQGLKVLHAELFFMLAY